MDAILAPLLPEFGYACEVGANDGTFLSNCKHFEEKGWVVLCVEPNPLLEPYGRACRKLWRQVAAGPEDLEDQIFQSHGAFPHASNSAIGAQGGTQHPVSMRRLDRILEEAGFPRLDLLTVDVEGWETRVMAGFTVERWKPKFIVIEEFMGPSPQIPDGYHLKEKRGFDLIWARSEP